jgi:hypothetical protein
MAHWAEIDSNNIVLRVTVGDNNLLDEGYQWLIDNLGGTWIKTSFNTRNGVHVYGGTPLHKNYAGIGYTFDGIGFYELQPYSSWKLNQEKYLWEAPKQKPDASFAWLWDERTLSWVEPLK